MAPEARPCQTDDMPKRPKPPQERKRFAVCLDDSGGPEWLKRHHCYRVLPDYYTERDGMIRIGDDFGEEDEVFDAAQFLVGEEATRYRIKAADRKSVV